MIATKQSVFRFGSDVTDGDGSMGQLLGGKGAGLAEMTLLGVPVPPGFTISTDTCRYYFDHGELPGDLASEIADGLGWMESNVGKRMGNVDNPMIVSVRSGAPVSMPGMMDTVLNLGLNDLTVRGLAKSSGSEAFALDSYRRLIQMFSSVVMDVPKDAFENAAEQARAERASGASEVEILLNIIKGYKSVVEHHAGQPFPQDTGQQLEMAILAVFRSWRSDRATFYRKLNGISDEMGTAVTVQTMVSATCRTIAGQGSALPVILRTVSRECMASISQMPKAKTSSPVPVRPRRSASCRSSSPQFMPNLFAL